jgi:hypothetical protein
VRPGSGDIDGLVRQGGGGGGGGVGAGAGGGPGGGAGAGGRGADRPTGTKSSFYWEQKTLKALVIQKWSHLKLFFGQFENPLG